MITVLVADDHEVFRWGLVRVLSMEPGIIVVGEVADAPTAVRAAADLDPDVVLLDLSMPGDSWSALEQILARRPARRVVILSADDDEQTVAQARRAGAFAHVSKAASPSHLLQVLHRTTAPT